MMKRMLKILIGVWIAFLFSGPVVGQKVASPAGGHFQNSVCQLDWTLGEVAIQTYDNGSSTMTVGFHQPELLITKIPDAAAQTSSVLVYPNPAHDKITIQMSEGPEPNTTARLFDGLSRLVSFEDLQDRETILSVAGLPAGNYTLTVSVGNSEIHQFKIIKTIK